MSWSNWINGFAEGRLTVWLMAGLSWCGTPYAAAETKPVEGVVNYETPHVRPLALTPDKKTLLAVNTAGHRLEVFDVSQGTPYYKASVRVGLEPVSVRVRSNTEAWVVNHLSDSVSVVNLERLTVVATLLTDNEPADVVFAGQPEKAYVSCSEANTLNIFDVNDLAAPPQKLLLAGEEPRALAVSPDGMTVYVAFFESGNRTTVLNGRASDTINVVSRPEGPYGGQNPPPNAGKEFRPPIASRIGKPPQVSLIVRQDEQGRWMDDNGGDWSVFVSGSLASLSGRTPGWQVLDHDVAVVQTATQAVSYQTRLMNIVMAMDVNPVTGQVLAVGTEAMNHIRYEPNLRGVFLRVLGAFFQPGQAATWADLNPHLDYQQPTVEAAKRTQSVGDPRGVIWRADGRSAFVTCMGSNNVVEVAPDGTRLGLIPVGEGPTGVVLDETSGRGYVLNKFAGSISVLDLNARQEVTRVAFEDPTPAVIKEGRPFFYNTHLSSGLGHVSCASCHVDGKTDRLAWDLGDPSGTNVQVEEAHNSTGAALGKKVTVSAMKGPMVTQTLQDIMKFPSLHWRGDRPNLASFAEAYRTLHGRETAASAEDMQKLGNFLRTLHLPPNPYRRIDDSRPNQVTLPDGTTVKSQSMQALLGQNSRTNNCLRCHTGEGARNRASNPELGQAFVAPALTGFYKKLGFWPKLKEGSTSGIGFFHDGSDSVLRVARVNVTEKQEDMLAEIMTLEGPTGPLTGNRARQDTHAGVGQQVTVAGPASAETRARVQQLASIANDSPHVVLVAVGRRQGQERGYYLLNGNQFQSDRKTEQRSLDQLLADAANGDPVTFTLVATGTETRFAVDRNLDGVWNGDEALPPVLTSPGDQQSKRWQAVSLTLAAHDPNGDLLTFSAQGLPEGLSLDVARGVIEGTIRADTGTYPVTVTVSDGQLQAEVSFQWTVTEAEDTAGQPGLLGEYYEGAHFVTKLMERVDVRVAFFWPEGTAPAPGVPHDYFSVRWTGTLRPRFSETYTFYLDADDGVRLWLNDMLILDQWNPSPGTYYNLASVPVTLVAGRDYKVKIEFQDYYSDAFVQFRWASASEPEALVPKECLTTPDPAADRRQALEAWPETERSLSWERGESGGRLSVRVPAALAESGWYGLEESFDARTWVARPDVPVITARDLDWAWLVFENLQPSPNLQSISAESAETRFFRLVLRIP